MTAESHPIDSTPLDPQAPDAKAGPLAAFGPNEWLVDEMYQSYLRDKDSVNPAWWDFFDDYTPSDPHAAASVSGDAVRPDGQPRAAGGGAGP